ncbi:MAG: glutamine-hydrolyzing GMP synthase [Spirochaetales bacterium]|nr:glutamine-hydrolyzing GMP synthase [Spirochaetales bacterium]
MSFTKAIAILDCGGQYTKVIDRKVREQQVYSEIFPINVKAQDLKNFRGIIFSGGPESVWSDKSLKYDPAIFELGLPMLGICYGLHLVNYHFKGTVKPGIRQEYGETDIQVDTSCPLFKGLEKEQRVLMSHGDSIEDLAFGFKACAMSENIIAALYHPEKRIYGVQFHPEVDLTENGKQILKNFLFEVSELKEDYCLEDRIESSIKNIQAKVKDKKVLVLVSGGVDSAVTAALLLKALPPEQVYAVHIDHGFMRKNESDVICENLKDMGLDHLERINGEEAFLTSTPEINGVKTGPLNSVVDPETKRNIIGHMFIEVLDQATKRFNLDIKDLFLAQGTLRPDLIESGNPDVSSYAHKIKTHHNDVDVIRKAREEGKVIETNWDWHKDEVRQVARILGLDEAVASRQPFPGPGLAIRYICYDGKLKITAEENRIFQEALKGHNSSLYGKVVPIKTVGVQGDCRSYRHLSMLWDTQGKVDWKELYTIGTRLPNQLNFINRVAYVLNKQIDTSQELVMAKTYLEHGKLELLREVDAIVRKYFDRPEISQAFAVLLPFGLTRPCSVAIRSFITNDFMTGRPAMVNKDITLDVLDSVCEEITSNFSEIDLVLYDITSKPPATVEWE